MVDRDLLRHLAQDLKQFLLVVHVLVAIPHITEHLESCVVDHHLLGLIFDYLADDKSDPNYVEFTEEEDLIPQQAGYRNVECGAEERQDPAKEEDRAADKILLYKLIIHFRAYISQKLPEHLVCNRYPFRIECVEIVQELV